MALNVLVRQDILTSWQRCVVAGLRPDHANAQMVIVSVELGRGVLSLSVRDDGSGGADPDGSGLAGLRERAEALGGILKLTSPPGRGTSVDVKLPAAPR